MATVETGSAPDAAPSVTVNECNDPEHKHDSKHPIPPGGCPDPRQAAPPEPEPGAMARLNCQIPSELEQRVKKECEDRMIGVGLLVAKALEKFLDGLPPAL